MANVREAPPAGWYPDPDGSAGHRWWDGSAWTDHRAPVQQAPPGADLGNDPVELEQTADAAPLKRPRGRHRVSAEAAPSREAAAIPSDAQPRQPSPGEAVLEPAPIRPVLSTPSRARWGAGSIVSIVLAIVAFVLLALWLSPWWLLLPAAVFGIMWLTVDRGRYLASVQAAPADPERHAALIRYVHDAAAVMGIRAPELYVSPQPVMNAFALTDRRGGAVCVFQGLLDLLSDEEAAAVLAHEVGHIKNRDTFYSVFFQSVRVSLAIVIGFVAAIAAFCIAIISRGRGSGLFAALFGAGIVLIGSAAAYVLLTFGSRSREYGADRHAAETHTDPLALGRALTKMEQSTGHKWELGEVPSALAARCIVRPYASGFVSELISSHPSTANRIARIERLIGPERAAQLRRESAEAEWRRAAEAHRRSVEIARRAQPGAFPSDSLFAARPHELLWLSASAAFAEPSRSARNPELRIGEEGRLLITTQRAVFLSPSGRTEWEWSELNDRSWLAAGAGDGSVLMLGVTRRQRNSGVWMDRSTAGVVAPFLELALAEARGAREAHIARLEGAAAEHEALRASPQPLV